ncbi:MAG: hypothetical protein M1831_001518 [Alyxoria varia]|nr:MAG: hypothetical protein M1831_001518 [Alyxoria varia]
MHKLLALAALTLLSTTTTMVTAKPAKMCALDISKRFIPDCEAQGKVICGECRNECCDKEPSPSSEPAKEEKRDDPTMCIMSIPNCKENEEPCGECKQSCCPKSPPENPDDPTMCIMRVPDCKENEEPCGTCKQSCCPKPPPREVCTKMMPVCEKDEVPCGKCNQSCCPKPPKEDPDDPIMCTMVMPICDDNEVPCGECNHHCCPKEDSPKPCPKPKPKIKCAPGFVAGGRCGTTCLPERKEPEPCPNPKPLINCKAPLVPGGHCGLGCVQPKKSTPKVEAQPEKSKSKRDAHALPEAEAEAMVCTNAPATCKAPQKPCGICDSECCDAGDPELYQRVGPGVIRTTEGNKPEEETPKKKTPKGEKKKTPEEEKQDKCCKNQPFPKCKKGNQHCGFCGEFCFRADQSCPRVRPPPGFEECMNGDTEESTEETPQEKSPEEEKQDQCCKNQPIPKCKEGSQRCGFCGEFCFRADQSCPRVRPPPGFEECMNGDAEEKTKETPEEKSPEEKKQDTCCKNQPIPKCKEGSQRCGFCGELCYPPDRPCPRVRPPPGFEECMNGNGKA